MHIYLEFQSILSLTFYCLGNRSVHSLRFSIEKSQFGFLSRHGKIVTSIFNDTGVSCLFNILPPGWSVFPSSLFCHRNIKQHLLPYTYIDPPPYPLPSSTPSLPYHLLSPSLLCTISYPPDPSLYNLLSPRPFSLQSPIPQTLLCTISYPPDPPLYNLLSPRPFSVQFLSNIEKYVETFFHLQMYWQFYSLLVKRKSISRFNTETQIFKNLFLDRNF